MRLFVASNWFKARLALPSSRGSFEITMASGLLRAMLCVALFNSGWSVGPFFDVKTCALDPLVDRPIWQFLCDHGVQVPTGAHLTLVAVSTASQYDYEVWLASTYTVDYDPQFFWSTFPNTRTWLFVGTVSLLHFLWLCGVAEDGPWIDMQLYCNWFPGEYWYGGLCIQMRTSQSPETMWQIYSSHLSAVSIWKHWRSIYLPWWPLPEYSTWSSFRELMPSVPIYIPGAPIKKSMMFTSCGKPFGEVEWPGLGPVPRAYADKVWGLLSVDRARY